MINEGNKTNNIELDIQQHINLKNIVGNRHGVEMAANYCEQYYHNQNDIPFLKPILLVGPHTKTFAQAISNSFGNTTFRHVCGTFFSTGCLELNNYYSYGDSCSTNYIANIDKLTPLNQYKLWRIFVECRINYVRDSLPISSFLRRHLHIFSAQNTNQINHLLLDKMGTIIYLSALNESEILEVLRQRVKLMNLKVETEDILVNITHGCAGQVNRAIEIFSLALCLMRAENQTHVLMKKHSDRALYLFAENLNAFLKNELT